MSEIIIGNLISPVVLFFILGLIAAMVKSDLKFPSGLSEALSIYLLIAIGIKGGIELSHYSLSSVIIPIMGALFLGICIPIITLVITQRGLKMDLSNGVGLAATYGSVSIVTYGAAIAFLEKKAVHYEGYMNAIVVLLESPAILVSLLLLNLLKRKKPYFSASLGIVANSNVKHMESLFPKEVIKESLFGKSVLLLVGSLFIGLLVGEQALPAVKPLFFDLYNSILILFLLNMGLIAGKHLIPSIKENGFKLIVIGVFTPILFGVLGVFVGLMSGLSIGGTMLMGVLAGSASYIAAPAALRTSVPEANPSIYLGSALGLTFPFNLIVGIPIYYQLALVLS